MKKLLLNLSSVALIATPALAIVSCGSTSSNSNNNNNNGSEIPTTPDGELGAPDSDKVPPKQRVKIVIPFTTDWYGENRITTYKLGTEAEILKLNSHIKGINLENWITLTKGRLLENAINSNLEYNKYDVDNFFKGIAIAKERFEKILKLFDKETIFKKVEK